MEVEVDLICISASRPNGQLRRSVGECLQGFPVCVQKAFLALMNRALEYPRTIGRPRQLEGMHCGDPCVAGLTFNPIPQFLPHNRY